MVETAELREKYPWFEVMRDNAGENKSKDVSDYFTSLGVANRYSTAYEQHQDESGFFCLNREWLNLGSAANIGLRHVWKGLQECNIQGKD